jgi:YD repeat-containing protein
VYGYNTVGSMTNLTDTKGNVTRWTYDLLGRQTAKIYADNSGDTFSYDPVGNLIGVTNAAGQVVSHEYDSRNRLTNSLWSVGSAPTVTRSYDAAGRLQNLDNGIATSGYAYDNANQLLAETNTVGGISAW